VARGVKSVGPCADGTDANATKSFDDTANGEKFHQILAKPIGFDGNSMIPGEGKLYAVLAKVVADRDLAAEGIATALESELIEIVGASMNEDRAGEFAEPQG